MAPSNSNAAKTEAQVEVEGCSCSRGMAGLETKRRRSGGGNGDAGDTGGGHGLGSLTGIGAVQHAFHFLDGPADVLRASTASRRWRELATADVVWRPKAVREGMVEKAGVFEVALPAAAAAAGSGSGGGGSSSAAAAQGEEKKDELAGVGLSFYSQIYVLKVPIAHVVGLRAAGRVTTARTRARPLRRALTTIALTRACLLDRGTR